MYASSGGRAAVCSARCGVSVGGCMLLRGMWHCFLEGCERRQRWRQLFEGSYWMFVPVGAVGSRGVSERQAEPAEGLLLQVEMSTSGKTPSLHRLDPFCQAGTAADVLVCWYITRFPWRCWLAWLYLPS